MFYMFHLLMFFLHFTNNWRNLISNMGTYFINIVIDNCPILDRALISISEAAIPLFFFSTGDVSFPRFRILLISKLPCIPGWLDKYGGALNEGLEWGGHECRGP